MLHFKGVRGDRSGGIMKREVVRETVHPNWLMADEWRRLPLTLNDNFTLQGDSICIICRRECRAVAENASRAVLRNGRR